jgi:hypothetical protein
MPQNTNLNVPPYNDDFNEQKNYHKVLFKPGTPIQSRELTTLQTILQNQIERFGTYIFKEGAKVIPGQTSYYKYFKYVQIDPTFFGVPVSEYLDELVGVSVVGETSGVKATVSQVIKDVESDRNNNTLYIRYTSASNNDFETQTFIDGERLITESDIDYGIGVIRSGNVFATCISENATGAASIAEIQEGIYFIRGYFVRVNSESLILDQYSSTPNYRVGLLVSEEIVTSFDDESLNDNAQGFSNFSAPGADRFKISTKLIKKSLTDFSDENFIELMRIENGGLLTFVKNTELNLIRDELARRTADESGDYYVKPFEIFAKESLNDQIANGGIYLSNQLTAQGNIPSEDLITLQISPGKAYVKGYEIEKQASTFIDIRKPEESIDVQNYGFPFRVGNRLNLNRVSGSPIVGFGTTAFLSLRSERLGTDKLLSPGQEIGKARCYDFKLKDSVYSNDTTEFETFLYDIDTYTQVSIGSSITLSTPALIEGNSSGSKGYLTNSITNSNLLILNSVRGSFIAGESISVNGISSSPTISTVRDYSIFDIKSLFSTVGVSTFSADLTLPVTSDISDLPLTISAASNGISTVTGINSRKIAAGLFVGDIIGYFRPGFSTITYNKITSIGSNLNTVSFTGITTVPGVCDGALPSADLFSGGVRVALPNLNDVSQAFFFQAMPHPNISNINLDNTQIVYRKTYSANVAGGGCVIIETDPDSTFEPFSIENFVLTYSDGRIEPLSSGKIIYSQDLKTINLFQLTVSTDPNARLTATLRKFKVNSKVKTLHRCAKLTIDKSSNPASGISTINSLNDGLTYSNIYGIRVQDKEICVNTAELLRVQAIYESNDNNDPNVPTLSLRNINGSLLEVPIGDQFIGDTSGAAARLVSVNGNNIEYVYQNEREFQVGESFTFKLSQVSAVINSIISPDRKITDNYLVDSGERFEFLDFGRVIRKDNAPAPSRKITIIYDYYDSPPTDSGEFYSYLSWPPRIVHDGIDLPRIDPDRLRNSDMIDLRPRVANYNPASKRSPFEFASRIFPNDGTSVTTSIVPNSQMILSYSYRIGRIDKIVLSKDGKFEVIPGEPAEQPVAPITAADSFEIATVQIQPYSYHARTDINVRLVKHKRYQMRDIRDLENRIQNIEYYTALSLLESETQNLSIKDPVTGLDRFKNGFFVDNFSGHEPSNVLNPDFKASIDRETNELRPSHYTTALDLLIGSASAIGIGTTVNVSTDLRFVTDFNNANIRRTGDLITLNYTEKVFAEQKFATRVVNVNPYAIINWIGNIELNPASDTWIEEKMIDPQRIEIAGEYDAMIATLQIDPNTGLTPIDWKAWETVWVGKTVQGPNVLIRKGNTRIASEVSNVVVGGGMHQRRFRTTTYRDTYSDLYQTTFAVSTRQTRDGIQYKVTPRIDEQYISAKVVSRDVIPYCRERNIEFIARRLKPSTQVYCFFENVDMTQYCVPKLLEITMRNGVFLAGESIRSLQTTVNASQDSESFVARLAVPDHKYGPYLNPTLTFANNPYNSSQPLSPLYSTTSTILNIDTASLSDMVSAKFKGRVKIGTILKGDTSGAEAVVSNLRLIPDAASTLIGSLYIPNPKFASNPQFATGTKTFKLTSSPTNNPIPGEEVTAGESKFTSSGTLDTKQGTIIATRNANVETFSFKDSRIVNSTESGTINEAREETRSETEWIDPLAQSFLVPRDEDCFITSVDVFFQSKDPAIPVTCQIRTMNTGLPTTTIIPFAEVSLEPSQVNISQDGTVPTRFVFPSPVFLSGAQEYAITLISLSNSYNAWIARMGEIDITTVNLDENQRVTVSQQPYMGSLFKSQNGSTWDASQTEDLKFILYRGEFTTDVGVFPIYNPELSEGNQNIVTLRPQPIFTPAKEIIVGLGSTVPSANLIPGVTITQINNPSASGKLVRATGAIGIGSTTGTNINLTINNVGSGVTPSTGTFYFGNVPLVAVSGSGSGAVAIVQVTGGQIGVVTVTNGGRGYSVGDVVSAKLGSTSENVRFNVGVVTALNQIAITQVQGTFNTSDFLAFDNVGIASTLPAIPTSIEVNNIGDGTHMIVAHRNHGMHAASNLVTLSQIDSDYLPVKLNAEYSNTSTGDISLSSVSIFNNFENVGVSSTNPGYVVINNEIIKYEGVSGLTLTGITRGIDNTLARTHPVQSDVNKYEFNGVSLKRINKTHSLNSATVPNPRTLDTYAIKIDTSSDGVDRSEGNSGGFQPLFFNENKIGGGFVAKATQNIQFEAITPNIATITPAGTYVVARMRTVTGTSIGGNEVSFQDYGFEPIPLDTTTYLPSPRIICSRVNELTRLNDLPGNKSFAMEFILNTDNPRLSSVIDLQRLNIITTSNRIDNPVSDYVDDRRVNLPVGDPHAAVYVSKTVSLSTPAKSLQVRFAAFRDSSSVIRVFYKLNRADLPESDQPYFAFPGYNNLIKTGANDTTDYTIIDPSKNDGLPNENVNSSIIGFQGEFLDYLYSQDNLPPFTGFTIKIVMSGTNQASPPRIKELRAIALAS